MALFFCEGCKRTIPEGEVRKDARTEEEERRLREFAAEIAEKLGGEAKVPEGPARLFHDRVEVVRVGTRSRAIGSRLKNVRCGPVREATPEEVSAHDEESRWKALCGGVGDPR